LPTVSGTNSQEGRVFTVGTTNLTEFYETYFPTYPDLWPILTEAYAEYGSPYDVASQIFTEVIFQCPEALFANASAESGLKAWRYYFNASFPNLQIFPNAGVYHASELPLVFRTYPPVNVTAQEYALSDFMQHAWAQFAKNPEGGPGWNPVGSAGEYLDAEEDEDLGVLGNVGSVKGSGVTVARQSDVDFRCGLFAEVYAGV
jgi:acetylcholinesterase